MKALKCSVILLITLVTFQGVSAQTRYYGQWAGSISSGYGNNGVSVSLSAEKYIGRTLSAIKGEYTFSHCSKKFEEWSIPIQRHLLEISYFYSLERQMGGKCFLNIGGGFFGGLENFGKVSLPYGVKQAKGLKFVSGIFLYPQLEFRLSSKNKNIVGLFEPQISYDFLSQLNKFAYRAQVGIKYYF